MCRAAGSGRTVLGHNEKIGLSGVIDRPIYVLAIYFSSILKLTASSPVPAGRRVAFFAGPKKVTKEKTALRWAMWASLDPVRGDETIRSFTPVSGGCSGSQDQDPDLYLAFDLHPR